MKLHVYEEIYEEARKTVQNLIRKKENEEKLRKTRKKNKNPEKLLEILNQLRLLGKWSPTDIYLKAKDLILQYLHHLKNSIPKI